MKKKVLVSMIVGIVLFLLSNGCMPSKVKLVKVLPLGESSIFTLSFSSDGKLLASASSPVKVWDVSTWQCVWELKEIIVAELVAFSPDGTLLAAGCVDEEVDFFDVATRSHIATIKAEERFVSTLAFSPDGKLLAIGGEQLKLWDVATRKVVATLIEKTKRHSALKSIAFSPDGKLLVSGITGSEYKVELWDVATGKILENLTGRVFEKGLTFSPDGKLLAGGGTSGTVKLLDVATRKPVSELKGHRRWADTLAFSPDGKLLAIGGVDGSPIIWEEDKFTIRIWDVKSRKCIDILKGFTDFVDCVAFSPDGKFLVGAQSGDAGEEDAQIRIWEMK